jgi:hypothetical protein
MELDKLYANLVSNLLRPLIFYGPTDLLAEDKKQLLDDLGGKDYFKQIKLIETDGRIKDLDIAEGLVYVYEKSGVLQKNMFLLFDMSKTLDENKFQYLLDKYIYHLNFYVQSTGWLLHNLHTYYPECEDQIVTYFTEQKQAFDTHLQEFLNHFPRKVIQFNSTQINDYVEENIHRSSRGALVEYKPLPKKDIKKDRKKLINDKQATEFLLESVFNVKL